MYFNQWAAKWGIPIEAVAELIAITGTGINTTSTVVAGGLSETATQNNCRLEAARKDCKLMRNNSGAYNDDRGVQVRYGLCNDSKKLNKKVKSSDLIGIRKLVITPEMVGQIIGQFVAREMKPESWTYSATEREVAQLKFINIINEAGGDAKFSTGGF